MTEQYFLIWKWDYHSFYLMNYFHLSRKAKTHIRLSRLMTKPTKWHVHPVKTQISLDIRPVWPESSLSAWRKFGSLATHWAYSKDSGQTGQMPRLKWAFSGCTVILLVLTWGDSDCSSLSLFTMQNFINMTMNLHITLFHPKYLYNLVSNTILLIIYIEISKM